MRSLIDKIVLTPDVGENRLVSDLHGSLAGILGMATQEKAKPQLTDQAIAQQKAVIDGSRNNRSAAQFVSGDASEVKLVAGARNQLKYLLFAPDITAWRYATN